MLQLTHFTFEFTHRSEHRTEKVMASITDEMLEKVLYGLDEVNTDGEIAAINMSREIKNSKIVSSVDTIIKDEDLTEEEKKGIYHSLEALVTTSPAKTDTVSEEINEMKAQDEESYSASELAPSTVEEISPTLEASPIKADPVMEEPVAVEQAMPVSKKKGAKAMLAAAASNIIKIVTPGTSTEIKESEPESVEIESIAKESTDAVEMASSTDTICSDAEVAMDMSSESIELSSKSESDTMSSDNLISNVLEISAEDLESMDAASDAAPQAPLSANEIAQKNMILAGIRIKNHLKALYGDSIMNEATLKIKMNYAKV